MAYTQMHDFQKLILPKLKTNLQQFHEISLKSKQNTFAPIVYRVEIAAHAQNCRFHLQSFYTQKKFIALYDCIFLVETRKKIHSLCNVRMA